MHDRLKLRASDLDRQEVVDRLRGALEDGRLPMDEYEERMGLAYQAVTHGDLDPLCADLPAVGPVIAEPYAAPQPAAPPAVAVRAGGRPGLPAGALVIG